VLEGEEPNKREGENRGRRQGQKKKIHEDATIKNNVPGFVTHNGARKKALTGEHCNVGKVGPPHKSIPRDTGITRGPVKARRDRFETT